MRNRPLSLLLSPVVLPRMITETPLSGFSFSSMIRPLTQADFFCARDEKTSSSERRVNRGLML